MTTVKLLVGDVRDRIAEIPDGTVDLVVTSPPFLALRKYGDHADEMGSERTPAAFLDALLDLTVEFRRVLAPHGSIAIELGDTYSGSTIEQRETVKDATRRWGGADGAPTLSGFRGGTVDRVGAGWPLAKSLTLIPQMYPASLAYGRNLLNPAHTFTPWRVRNIITWCRPNPPVGALGDKVRPATSYITVACPSAKRWFDLDAVRTEFSENTNQAQSIDTAGARARAAQGGRPRIGPQINTHAGAPPLDWWDDALDPNDPTDHMTIVMPTQPYPGAHYATWPAKLAQRLIDMMCPRQVCSTCGRPSERIVGEAEYPRTDSDRVPARLAMIDGNRIAGGVNQHHVTNGANTSVTRQAPTLGWSDCSHDNWRPGHVLDPFAGSGTTLAVASGMGRDVTGIELYPENAWLVRERVGMFLELDGDIEPPQPDALDVLRDHFATQPDRFRSGYLRNDRPTRVPQTQGKVADRPIEDTDPV